MTIEHLSAIPLTSHCIGDGSPARSREHCSRCQSSMTDNFGRGSKYRRLQGFCPLRCLRWCYIRIGAFVFCGAVHTCLLVAGKVSTEARNITCIFTIEAKRSEKEICERHASEESISERIIYLQPQYSTRCFQPSSKLGGLHGYSLDSDTEQCAANEELRSCSKLQRRARSVQSRR